MGATQQPRLAMRPRRRSAARLLLDATVRAALLALALLPERGACIDNGLGLLPPMGWRSWNSFGRNVSQRQLEDVIEAMALPRHGGRSLRDLGFSDVGLDDGWQECGGGINGGFHNKAGEPIVNRSRFSDLAAMMKHARSRGLTMGWYANNCICSETEYVSPKEITTHYAGDVRSIIEYGFSGVKVDHCGQFNNLTWWADLFNESGHAIMIENCHWVGWVPRYQEDGNLWCPFNYFRVSSDIKPTFDSMMTNLQAMPRWADHEKPISQPGCWAYPDMLEVGNLESFEENRAHFAAWSITSSPLILGLDVTNASKVEAIWPIISNEEVLSVNQAWVGHPGTLIKSQHTNMGDMLPDYIWAVPCNDSDSMQRGWKTRSIGSLGSSTYMIVAPNGLCVDVTISSPAGLDHCNASSPMQIFTMRSNGAIIHQTADGKDQCVEVLGKTGPGVQRTQCFAGDPKHQRFSINSEGVWSDYGSEDDNSFPPRCLVSRPKYPFDMPSHYISWQIWAKPMPERSLAVLVLNRAEKDLRPIVSLRELKDVFGARFGLQQDGAVTVRDLYSREELGHKVDVLHVDSVPMRDSRLYLLRPVDREPLDFGGNVVGYFVVAVGLVVGSGAIVRYCCQSSFFDDSSSNSSDSSDSESGSIKLFTAEGAVDQDDPGVGGELKLASVAQIGLFTTLWWSAAIYVTLLVKLTAERTSNKAPVLPPFMLTFLVNSITGFFSWTLSKCISSYGSRLPQATPPEVLKVVTLGIVQGCEIGFINKSLQYLSISERTMLQNTNVLLMMITAQIFGLERLTWMRVAAALLLVGGGVCQGLASSHQEGASDSAPTQSEQLAHLKGIVFMLSSMCLTAFKWSLIQFMTQRAERNTFLGQMSKLQLAARVQPITGVVCLVLAASFEMQEIIRPELWHSRQLFRVPAIALGITVLMCSELKVVQLTSAVATGVLMNLHHIPMVLAGMIVFHDSISLYNVYGFALCVLGGFFYAGARYYEPPSLE